MARKTTTKAPKPIADFKDEAFANDSQTLDAHGRHLIAIDEKFGSGAPYQKELVEARAAFYLNQGSEAFFEAGKCFLQLKAHEQHGEFLKALERIGIDDRAARKMMSVATRFAHLHSLSKLPRSKLLELAILDDEELADLDSGGTVKGLTRDRARTMGVREMRAAIRKGDADLAEQKAEFEALLLEKDKKLNELARHSYEAWDASMGRVIEDLHKESLFGSEALSRVLLCAQAAARLKLNHENEREQITEFAIRICNDVNLLTRRVADIQVFVDEYFKPFVDTGATSVFSDEPIDVPPRKQ